MDGDVVIGILMVLLWLISSVAARFGKKTRQHEVEAEVPSADGRHADPRPHRPLPATLQKALGELAEQMGVEIEVAPAEAPVASEHTMTGGEHRQSALETFSTSSEHSGTISEHVQTASEVRRTMSETHFSATEHQSTESEHVRGDLRQARPAASGVPAAHHRTRSRLARRVVADLSNRGSLARAMILREILGPPVSMRAPDPDGL